jgi:hypothetical protein
VKLDKRKSIFTQKNNPGGLFFYFCVVDLFLAPFAILLELDFALNFFLIFPAPVIHPLAGFAG